MRWERLFSPEVVHEEIAQDVSKAELRQSVEMLAREAAMKNFQRLNPRMFRRGGCG